MMHVRSAVASAVVALVSLLSPAMVPQASAQFVFAEGTSQAEMDRYNQAWIAAHGPINRYITTTRWPGTLGEGARVTVSFVPDGVAIPAPAGVDGGDVGSSLFSTLDAQFTGTDGRTRWRTAIAQPDPNSSGPNANVVGGGVSVWQTATNVQLPFQRRTAGVPGQTPADNPATNFWDDGAPWGSPGPLHPPVPAVQALTIAFAPSPPTRVSATVVVNAALTRVTITLTPGPSPAPIDITAPANDTIGELVNTINLNAGFTAAIGSGVVANTPCSQLRPSQIANLSAATPTAAFSTAASVAPERGDIRIGMRPLPASILAAVSAPAADGGDIILNSTLQWTLGTNSRVLRTTVARAVGEALGLAQVCPSNKTKLMEPILNLNVTTPQIDDIRGIQRLYGDILDLRAAGFGADPTRPKVFEPNDDPLKNPSVADGPWPLGAISLAGDSTFEAGLSLDDVTDKDFFAFSLGSTTSVSPINVAVRITVTPTGGTYNVGAVDAACTGTPINASSVLNPRANLFTNAPAGLPLGSGSPASPTPFSSFIDTAPAGSAEIVDARLTSSGTYIIGVSATGIASNQAQLYNLRIDVVNLNLVNGVAFGPIVSDFDFVLGLQVPDPDQPQPRLDGFNGHGAVFFRRNSDGDPHSYNLNYLGSRALYATLEGEIPSATPAAFAGRSISSVQWLGVNPAVAVIGDHPTQTTAAGAGATVTVGDTYFRGVAPEARLATASLATFVDPLSGSFLGGNEAMYYSLFTLSDPVLAVAAGLPRSATVINTSAGSDGDTRGDSAMAWAYDATVAKYGTTIVVSAGNSGVVDNTDECTPGGGSGGETTLTPGGAFVGARTIGAPASAFNVLTVGAVGKGRYLETFPPPQDDGTGGGGGGGGSARGTAADEADPTGIALNTVVNFSSKGPVDTFNYTTNAQSFRGNARPGVHIVAAGTGLIARAIDPSLFQDDPDPCLSYGDPDDPGHRSTKGIGLPVPDPAINTRFRETSGTSFSSPTVAGAVALLQDFGLAQVPPLNIDSLVMRSVLMTSAVKLPGWTNNGNPAKPQDDRDGRDWEFPSDIISTQLSGNAIPLDLAQGAGLLSIPYAFSIYGLGDLRDSAFTDPKIPTQTPAGEVPLPEFPGTGGRPASDGRPATRSMPGVWSTQETADLRALLTPEPEMTAAQAERIFKDIQDLNRNLILKPHRPDTTDPDLTPGGGGKSAGTVDDREPFLPGGRVPGSLTGDGPAPTKPVVLTGPIYGGTAGWDIANLGIKPLRLASGAKVGGVMDYVINVPYASFSRNPNVPAPPLPDKRGDRTIITATLVWNRTITVKQPNFLRLDNPQVGQITELELENLDLELYQTATGEVFDGQEPVAFSRSSLSNIEHIHYPVASPGLYVLRVTWTGRDYNFFRNLPRGGVPYGLSWAWRPILDQNVSAPNTLPAPPVIPPAAGLPLLNEVLFRYGAEIGQANYSGLADVNQDGLVNTADLVWVLARLNVRPGVQYQDQ
jgi:hypothetical protein